MTELTVDPDGPAGTPLATTAVFCGSDPGTDPGGVVFEDGDRKEAA